MENDRLVANNYLPGTSCHSSDSFTAAQFSDQQHPKTNPISVFFLGEEQKFLGEEQKTEEGQCRASEMLLQCCATGSRETRHER